VRPVELDVQDGTENQLLLLPVAVKTPALETGILFAVDDATVYDVPTSEPL
jgi:hypothetical protein